ncbi:MAG: hypothetical protein ACXACI_05425 [Candidatus Hodarchaeales archaeon]
MLRPTCYFKFEEGHPTELLKFDLCRRKFERRLKELGDEATEKFDPVVHWMRLVIADKAPELLNETHFNK